MFKNSKKGNLKSARRNSFPSNVKLGLKPGITRKARISFGTTFIFLGK